MDELPSSVVMSNVSTLYKTKFFECEEEHIDFVLITTDGELLEITNKNILSSCKLCNKIKGYVTLHICYTYTPKIKYYVVLTNGKLFAVKKMGKSSLQCLHLLDNIGRFSVEDGENLGIPQIIASNVKDTIPPSVLNLSNIFNKSSIVSSRLISPAVLKLYSHVHAMRMQIKKVEQLLINKKTLISRMISSYMFITKEDVTLDCYEELATVFGEKSTQHFNAKNFPFSLGRLWIRICFEFWIIGVYLANLQNRKICNLELLLMDPNMCVERTVFYTYDERMGPFTLMTDFKKLDFIPCHGHGYILGVVKQPVFVHSTISFTCNLSFNFDKERTEQLHIGTIEVSHANVINSAYAAFHFERNVPDLLSIFATSLKSDIKLLKFNEEVQSKLTAILTNMKFSKINEKYFLTDCKRKISFRGVLLQIIQEGDSCILCFYSRDFHEICLYLQTFKQLPSDLITVKDAIVSVKTIFMSLFNEIKFFNDVIKQHLLKSNTGTNLPNVEIIPVDVDKINELINLEENTEYNFTLIKHCIKK